MSDASLRTTRFETGSCDIVHVYKDHGISGAKGRDKRPAFDRLCRDAAKRQFEMMMAWSVDRLGRSLCEHKCYNHPAQSAQRLWKPWF
jgi:DNA invertase Pin-like site-specific DNA recombinase